MKIKELNQATKHITRASKSTDPKKVELDMRKHILDTLNKYEDGPDIPSDTEPTTAERIASDKYLREQAVLPDSRGAFQREAKRVEKEALKPFIKKAKITKAPEPMSMGLDFMLENKFRPEPLTDAEINYKKLKAEHDKKNSELVGLETLLGIKA